MTTIELVHRDPNELKNYPLNISLYREHIDEDFVSSIREKGIQSPLTVCKSTNPQLNDFIVMGRRRRIAALTCKLKTVPCIVWECDDPLEFEERLILDNIRNETTVEERARMYEELLRIEAEKAARRRQKTTHKNIASPVTEKVPSPENIGEKGESSVKAAKQVGMSRQLPSFMLPTNLSPKAIRKPPQKFVKHLTAGQSPPPFARWRRSLRQHHCRQARISNIPRTLTGWRARSRGCCRRLRS